MKTKLCHFRVEHGRSYTGPRSVVHIRARSLADAMIRARAHIPRGDAIFHRRPTI